MNFALYLVVVFAGVAFSSAKLTDNSSVEKDCDSGCSSHLNVSLDAVGESAVERFARSICQKECPITQKERDSICPPLCGIQIKLAAIKIPEPETCILCNADAGNVINDCNSQLSGLELNCLSDCRMNELERLNGGILKASSNRSIYKNYPGAGCNLIIAFGHVRFLGALAERFAILFAVCLLSSTNTSFYGRGNQVRTLTIGSLFVFLGDMSNAQLAIRRLSVICSLHSS